MADLQAAQYDCILDGTHGGDQESMQALEVGGPSNVRQVVQM